MAFDPERTGASANPAAVTCFAPEESTGCCIDSVKPRTEPSVCSISFPDFLISVPIHHSGIKGNTILMIGLGNFCRLLTSPLLKGRVDSVIGYP